MVGLKQTFGGRGRDYWVLSAFMFFLFVGYAFVYAMYAIWLSQATQLSGQQIGIVFSLNATAALFTQPLLGFVQDRIRAGQHLLWFNVFTLLGAGPFFNLIYRPLLLEEFLLGAMVGSLYVALVFLAIAGAVETYIERISRFNQLEFGQIRTWGSLGWGSAALFTGLLINVHPDINFWVASASALVPLSILLFVRIPISDAASAAFSASSKVGVKDVVRVFRRREFLHLVLFVLGVASVYVIYDQQFPVFFATAFPTVEEGNRMYGYLNSAQIYLEAAGFFFAPWVVNRIGPKRGLLLAGGLMVLRILGSGLTSEPVFISMIKLLHAAELPILMVAVFKYLNKHFDHDLSATLFLVGFAFVTQIGTIVFAPLAGRSYDLLGFQPTYLVMAGVAGFFVLLSAHLLVPDSQGLVSPPMEKPTVLSP